MSDKIAAILDTVEGMRKHAERPLAVITQEYGITKQDARHVLYHFGDKKHGLQGGDFDRYFLMAMAHADHEHLTDCVEAFPALGVAYLIGAKLEGGADLLVQIAEFAP